MTCPRCGSELFDGSSPCPQCGYADGPAAAETFSRYAAQNEDALNGYLSYTAGSSNDPSENRSAEDPYISSEDRSVRDRDTSGEWLPYASVICGALSAYSSPMILPGILLGITSVILGIIGRSSPKKKLAVIGIIAGLIGLLLSVLVVLFYIGIFKLVYDFLFGGFGFRMFSGW